MDDSLLSRASGIQPPSLPLATGCSQGCPGDGKLGEGESISFQPARVGKNMDGHPWEDFRAKCGSGGHHFSLVPRTRSQGQPNHREAANIV